MDLLPNVIVEFDELPEEAHEVKEAPAEAQLQKAHEDIFEPPAPEPPVPKKKREATEKQKAHLKIIREKALARKREIQEEKRMEKAVKAHEDEEKRLKKNHYTRAEVDALVNQRFTEYQDKQQEQQDKHKQQHMRQQQQDKHKLHQDKHKQQHKQQHRKKWDTWI